MIPVRPLIAGFAATLMPPAAVAAPVLTVIHVTNANDSGAGSLRQAIIDSNFDVADSRIVFDGPFTIQPLSQLPSPAPRTTITGVSQNTASGEPVVTIDGTMAGPATVGLPFTGADCAAVSLVITNWPTAGLSISGPGSCRVTNCRITAAPGSLASGVMIDNSPGNAIGGPAAGEGNVLSGNAQGVLIFGAGSTGNRVEGNRIGTDPAGNAAVPNRTGVSLIIMAHDNTVGGNDPGAGNLIAGSTDEGVLINGGANTVLGNIIGLNAEGTAALGNRIGVHVVNAALCRIGSAEAASRNVISGNTESGILIEGTTAHVNFVEGNHIGTDPTGMIAFANSVGILLQGGASSNTVGGTVPGAGNLISGNTDSGIMVRSDTNLIYGNTVGLAADGAARLGNGKGITVLAGAGNLIGGFSAEVRNVISGNQEIGIFIDGATSTQNFVRGNYIGTDRTGMAFAGNVTSGVEIKNHADHNFIGGVSSAEGNVISGNGTGVFVKTDLNLIRSNLIGLAVDGVTPLGNSNGVTVSHGASNQIGGPTPGERNVISGNGLKGILLQDLVNSGNGINAGNRIWGNFIGTDVTGLRAAGNRTYGIEVNAGSSSNEIGAASPEFGNVIAGNGADGIFIEQSGGNRIQSNFIGVSASEEPMGNAGNGILVFSGRRNLIAHNHIFSNGSLGIALGIDQVTPNDPDDSDTGPNDLQNFPTLTAAHLEEMPIRFSGIMMGAPNTAYTIEIFLNRGFDPSGNGEGESPVFTFTLPPNPSNQFLWSEEFNGMLLGRGRWATATATDPAGNTSEFSPAILGTGRGPSAEEIIEALLGLIPLRDDYDANGDGLTDIADPTLLRLN